MIFSNSPARVGKISVATSIVLLLLAMILPACHLHPLLDKTAPNHCTICLTLHAALPMAVHVPSLGGPLPSADRVVPAPDRRQTEQSPRFAESRAPPLPAC